MALEKNFVGIVHAMMFPGPGNTNSVLRGEANRDFLLNTIQWIVDNPDYQGIELTRVKHLGHREEIKKRLKKARESKKIQEVVYGTFPVQLINEDDECLPSDICSLDEHERQKAMTRMKECIDEAYEYGADKFGFLSGKDPAIMAGLSGVEAEQMRQEALSQLRRSVHEICLYINEQNKKHKTSMRPMIKAFDCRVNTPASHAFKETLIGPADRTEQFCETIRNFYHHENFSLMLDTSHLIINGEGPEALKRLAPYLGHFHIANAVLNRNNPDGDKRYGDLHPALNVPDSELTQEVLAGYLQALVENDYRETISFEIKPIDSEVPEDVAESAKQFFYAARNRIDVNYSFKHNYKFITRKFFTDTLWDKLVDLRVEQPSLIHERLQKRQTRDKIAPDGKLVILAADHPARMVTNVGEDTAAMGDRFEYLGRCARVMMASDTDGIMATADVIEDLVLLDYLYQEHNETSFMDNKVLIACMNRGGLAGAQFEMFDRMTAYRDAKKIKALKLDGAKMLLRLSVPDRYDRYCIQTMEECARCVEACNDLDIPVFLEPLPVTRRDGGYHVIMQADELIKAIGVASGLSYSSANMWLKIPYVEEYDRVASAFSGPVLMLGGASTGNPVGVIEQFVRGMGEGANVRGAMVGRNVLFPGDDDPAAVAQAVYELVHNTVSANEAVKVLASRRGAEMDLLPRA